MTSKRVPLGAVQVLVYLPVSVASWQGVEEGVLHHEDGGWHFTDGGRRWLAQSVLNGVMLSLKSDQKDLMLLV